VGVVLFLESNTKPEKTSCVEKATLNLLWGGGEKGGARAGIGVGGKVKKTRGQTQKTGVEKQVNRKFKEGGDRDPKSWVVYT